MSEESRVRKLRARLAALAAGALFGPIFRLQGALYIAVAGVLLVLAWQSVPQRLLDARRYATFTMHADGRIVESWLALVWRPGDMGDHLRWHAYAKAEPCAIVEFAAGGDWGIRQRAFCGNRFMLREENTLETIVEMAPGVPFDWVRDERGFIVPEVRVDATSRRWLETHAPWSTFMMGNPPPATAFAALEAQVNSPVDAAVFSWGTPMRALKLAFDPQHVDEAMPAAYVDSRRAMPPGNWLILAFAGGIGMLFWLLGMRFILGERMPPRARAIFSAAPLLTLPLWSEAFPDALHVVSKDLSAITGDMIGDIDRTGRLIGAEPSRATLANGERLAFRMGAGVYAATFGRFRYTQPDPPPANADDALRALMATIAAQMRSLPVADQSAVLEQLTRDKVAGWRAAGTIFVPVARDVLVDPASDPALARRARRFLSEWVTQPIVEPYKDQPGFKVRLQMFEQLAALPINEIAIMARSVAERAAQRVR